MALPEGLLVFRNFLTEEEEQAMAFDIEFVLLDEENNQFMDFGKYPPLFSPLVQRFQALMSQHISSPSTCRCSSCLPVLTPSSTISSLSSSSLPNAGTNSTTSSSPVPAETSLVPALLVVEEKIPAKRRKMEFEPHAFTPPCAPVDGPHALSSAPSTAANVLPSVTHSSSPDASSSSPSSYFALPLSLPSAGPASLSWLQRVPLFDQVIVNRYEVGDGIKPHVDLAKFDDGVVGISFASSCIMEFRSLDGAQFVEIFLNPGDLYVMYGPSRYQWTHAIPHRERDEYMGIIYPRGTRLSVTLRKLILDANGLVMSHGRDGTKIPG